MMIRPSPNQFQGQVLSSYTHFGPVAPQYIHHEPKQRIRANFLSSPFEQYHFSNPFAGQLTSTGHFVAKQNFGNSFQYNPSGPGSYQLTNTFGGSPHKQPNSEPLRFQSPGPSHQFAPSIQQHQSHQQQSHQQQPPPPQGPSPGTKLSEPEPSYLPQLPTVPPSVLSPFFQVQQQQQEVAAVTSAPTTQAPKKVESSGSKLLSDEYTVNLVPPPPYKHKDASRFRPRPAPSTSSTSTTTQDSKHATLIPPTGPGDFDSSFDFEHHKAMEILNKYNIPAISPLQDTNRFNYQGGPYTSLTSTSSTQQPSSFLDHQVFQFWPTNNDSSYTSFTTDRPNVFRNLIRTPENLYEEHKLKHPSFNGGRRPNAPAGPPTTQFLPTPDTSVHDASRTASSR